MAVFVSRGRRADVPFISAEPWCPLRAIRHFIGCSGHERRRHYGENPGGESFGTDVSDPHSSYSRHLSQTHSKQPSFEQVGSFCDADMSSSQSPLSPESLGRRARRLVPDSDGAAPAAAVDRHHSVGTGVSPCRESRRLAPVGVLGQPREVGCSQSPAGAPNELMCSSFSFNLQSGPHVHVQQEDVTPENYSSPLQFEVRCCA